ncbi:hypothetical protein ACFW7M_32480, partial [Streptomyces sp. NPDC058739]
MNGAVAWPHATVVYERLLASVPPAGGRSRAWHVADPYVLRHAAQHASRAGRVSELLADTGFLVHAEPESVLSVLGEAGTEPARLAGAVYRASYAVHQPLGPELRRQILMIDAARFQAPLLAAEFAAGTVWSPRWAKGTAVSASNTAVLSGYTDAWGALALARLDGRVVAVTGNGRSVLRVWDLATGLASFSLSGHEGTVTSVTTEQVDGTLLAITASEDATVMVWDLTTGRHRATLTGHQAPVTAVATTHLDNTPIAITTSDDTTIRVWDLTSGTQTAVLTGHQAPVTAVATTHLDN